MDFSYFQEIGMGLIIPGLIIIAVGFFATMWLLRKVRQRAVKQRVKRMKYGGQTTDYELPVTMGCCVDNDASMAWFWDNEGLYTHGKKKDLIILSDFSAIPLYPGKNIDRTKKVTSYGIGGKITKLAETMWRMKAMVQAKKAMEEKNQELWKIAIGGLILIILVLVVVGLFKGGDLSLPSMSCGGP